jgi:type IV pilus assembly protein PilO
MTLAELNNLDPNNIGNWPGPIKGILILILCVAVLGAGFYFDTQDMILNLDKIASEEGDLKKIFEAKQRKAANLKPLRLQLAEMKQSFGAMLRLLPNKTEIEGLLVDISQSGLAAGLEFELFKPNNEVPAEFYAVKPISITVTGTYHQFGEFISAVAALPRIVTQHNIDMAPINTGEPGKPKQRMQLVAKTYRYLDEEEIEEEAEKNKGKRK